MMKAAEIIAMPVCREEAPDRHVTEREHRLRLADGRTIAYLDLDDAGGSPIFYFHGYPGSRLDVVCDTYVLPSQTPVLGLDAARAL